MRNMKGEVFYQFSKLLQLTLVILIHILSFIDVSASHSIALCLKFLTFLSTEESVQHTHLTHMTRKDLPAVVEILEKPTMIVDRQRQEYPHHSGLKVWNAKSNHQ